MGSSQEQRFRVRLSDGETSVEGIEGLLEAVNYINQTEQKNIKVSDEGELYVAEEEEKK